MKKPERTISRAQRRKAHEAMVHRRITMVSVCCASLAAILALTAILLQMFPTSNGALAPSTVSSTVSEPQPVPQPVVTTVRFSASGDNLIHDGLYMQAKARGQDGAYDFLALYENVAAFYQNYDVNWINQETLLTDDFPPAGYPMFASPTAVGKALYDVGFRVFALSNNHSYDKGAAGIASTLSFWNTMPDDVLFPGFYADQSDYMNLQTHTVNDITIAYLAYAEHTNGLPTPADAVAHVIYTSQTDVIEAQIKHARTIADIVIPTVHWGTENSHVVNNSQRLLAQQMADWGADIIIGTHPHVIQPLETITAAQTGKQVPVFYSLGNFASLQNQTDNLVEIVGTFLISKTTQPDGAIETSISDVQTHPLVMHYESGWRNGRVYWLADYTPELAAKHGNREISVEECTRIYQESIGS